MIRPKISRLGSIMPGDLFPNIYYGPMDNLSHALFGGSIVNVLWGKRYGAKATGYALLISNLPDIDVFVRLIPGVSSLQASFFHRTMTHSFLFAFVIAPLLGLLLARITGSGKQSWKDWTGIALVSLLSHILLDRCTTYGLRFLRPFSSRSYEAGIIGIIDLFFTLPLLILVVWAIIRAARKHTKLGWLRYAGVIYAFLYLISMAISQQLVKQSVAHDMKQADIPYTRIFASPQILQPFLWYTMVELPDGSYKTNYMSVFDKKPRTYENTYGYHELAIPAMQPLIARSHGWYQLSQDNNMLIFADMRFGKMLGWDKTLGTKPTFSYTINPIDSSIQSSRPKLNLSFSSLWQKHWQRVRGKGF